MDTLISDFLVTPNIGTALTIFDLILSIFVSFTLSVILAKVYVYTHSGISYSRSYVVSLILVSVTISLIMIIIGSNIARAFALVGAMSIVRFRNPVKDSRDLVFVFMAIAIGMASGTQFYSFALIFTLFVSAAIFGLDIVKFGEIRSRNYVLRIVRKPNEREILEKIFKQTCKKYFVVSIDRLADQPETEEVVYELELRKSTDYDSFITDLGRASPTSSVSLLVGESNISA